MLKIALTVATIGLALPASAQGIYGNPYGSSPYSSNPHGSNSYGSNPYGSGTGSNPSSHGVQGYTNHSGTYVQPHQQTNPNSTQYDNYGTRGNVNPYTGTMGTRSPRY